MKKFLLLFVIVPFVLVASLCIGAASAYSPVITLNNLREQTDGTPSEIKAMISRVCNMLEYQAEPLIWLAGKESSYDHTVMGDNNKAYFLYQYHMGTWKSMIKKYKLEYMNLKIDNPVDQTILTVYALRDGQHRHGTPYLIHKNAPR